MVKVPIVGKLAENEIGRRVHYISKTLPDHGVRRSYKTNVHQTRPVQHLLQSQERNQALGAQGLEVRGDLILA
jgi:hypothetical protein